MPDLRSHGRSAMMVSDIDEEGFRPLPSGGGTQILPACLVIIVVAPGQARGSPACCLTLLGGGTLTRPADQDEMRIAIGLINKLPSRSSRWATSSPSDAPPVG